MSNKLEVLWYYELQIHCTTPHLNHQAFTIPLVIRSRQSSPRGRGGSVGSEGGYETATPVLEEVPLPKYLSLYEGQVILPSVPALSRAQPGYCRNEKKMAHRPLTINTCIQQILIHYKNINTRRLLSINIMKKT